MKRLVKLVRDRVQRNADGGESSYEQIKDHSVYIQQLRAKLVEEAVEYIQDPSMEELADVLEVVQALCKHDLGYEMHILERARQDKFRSKGGFGYGIGLYVKLKELG